MSPEASTIGGDQSLEELRRELAEAREQQAATAEILRVISSSPMDSQRVFAEIAAGAARLCEAYDVAIRLVHTDFLRLVAHDGPIPLSDMLPLTRGIPGGRAVLDRQTVHVADMQIEAREFPEGSEGARRLGFRTVLGVPLIRAGEAIGAIVIRRTEVRPFTDRQIDLLTTFADQAVIAIENTRLFEQVRARTHELTERTQELTETLKYQTATSEVLSVIGRSTFELERVLEAVVESATRLCTAKRGHIFRFDGEYLRYAAAYGAWPGFKKYLETHPTRPGRGGASERAALEGRTVHIADVLLDSDYDRVDLVNEQGYRTVLAVPMLREGTLLGVIAILKTHVDPFTDKQIALVETFAHQAVIAIENVRLLNELRVSLQQQTATADVLKVISRSPFQLQTIFNTLVEAAARLCEADTCGITRQKGTSHYHVAHYGFPPALFNYLKSLPLPSGRASLVGRVLLEGRTVQIADASEDPDYRLVEAQRMGGFRTLLGVPLLRQGGVIGVLTLARSKVQPFTKRQIELLTTFADQAVIAIENTRLFEEVQTRTRELTDALEQQTASAKILSVLSASPGEVRPVFDTILEEATRLCEAQFGVLHRFDGTSFIPVGVRGGVPELLDHYKLGIRPSATNALGRLLRTKQPVHLEDAREGPGYKAGDPAAKSVVEVGGARSYLLVPLLTDDEVIGTITIFRQEVRPFSEKQIQLLSSFANQAVIAIENARLFEEVQASNRELTEALEQQTATSEVLKVIGRSTFDLQPVLETLVENAVRLCSASTGIIFRFDGEAFRWAADYGNTPEHRDFQQRNPVGPGPGSTMGRAALYRRTIQIPDVLADPEFEHTEAQKIANFRTLLGVPMFREGVLLGVFSLQRREVKPFTDKQIELVETFADQAVIAIENVRLFEEAQARARELARSVQELQALGEVGRAVSSTLDLKSVLKTIVDRAVHLSGTDAGSIFYYRADLGKFELGETTGLDEEMVARFRKLDISLRGSGLAEAIAKRQPLQIPDLTQRSSEPLRDAAIEAGFRASLVIPLLRAEGPLGTLILRRRSPGEFPANVVSLMQSFADQSAIALENARLFEEIAQKSRELELASQHKSQFVANMSHELRTPLAAILGYAELIQEGFYEPQGPKSLAALTRIRSNGKHLLGLINTVLDIAKIESGQFNLNLGEYALESVVETVRSATESLAQNKKLALTTEVARPLPIGLGDEQRLTQVLLNLVGNAIKFTDTGEVRVTAKAVNGHFNVSVTDTGPGIPEDERARIFEQFHQIDSSLTKAQGGTGLGLAIAKQIVEMHGGRIWVESTLGEGATFQMELPIVAENRKAMA